MLPGMWEWGRFHVCRFCSCTVLCVVGARGLHVFFHLWASNTGSVYVSVSVATHGPHSLSMLLLCYWASLLVWCCVLVVHRFKVAGMGSEILAAQQELGALQALLDHRKAVADR
jgi:hypothetical protein